MYSHLVPNMPMPGVVGSDFGRPRSQKWTRTPSHKYQVVNWAFEIQPVVVAPVLAGETLRGWQMQDRVVTDPIENSLAGWWNEYFAFYTPLSVLDENYKTLLMDPDYDTSSDVVTADHTYFYRYKGGMNFVAETYTQIILDWFRDEIEAATTPTSTGRGLSYGRFVGAGGWLDSAIDATDITTDDEPSDFINEAGTDTFSVKDIHDAMANWQWARLNAYTQMSWAEWLQTYGVKVPDAELRRPEYLGHWRDWSYPTNTVDGAGDINSQVVWSTRWNHRRRKYFKEPGIFMIVALTRPKTYSSTQVGAGVGLLDDAFGWMPQTVLDPSMSIKEYPSSGTDGIVRSTTNAYRVDRRDVFVHGDQFVNFSLASTDKNLVAMPDAALDKYYPTDTMAKSFFIDKVTSAFTIRREGVCRLNVNGHVRDYT